MAKLTVKNKLKKEFALLAVLTAISFLLSVYRVYKTGSIYYLFLNWNLFLAAVPWFLSTFLLLRPRFNKKRLILLTAFSVWILFFPNAPYILTDLFHLRDVYTMPVWFDLMLILFYAWTGLLFGFLSLAHFEKLLQRYLQTPGRRTLFTITVFFLSGFGVYVGRYLRWNSWDIIRQPGSLVRDMLIRFIRPLDHPHTWGLTLSMGLFLLLVYYSFKLLNNSHTSSQETFQ